MVSILPGAPWLIAHRTMLGINRPYKVTLNGTDYVLWQSSDGTISALENSCPHMQAPLSEGWICRDRNTITCPFHALEFDSTGWFIELDANAERGSLKSLAKPLNIVIQGDFIWTYGNEEPKLEIPSLHKTITAGSIFVGATGDRAIEASFLNAIMINYDFNHAFTTHRHPLKLQQVNPSNYKESGHRSSVTQEIIRENNSWLEKLKNPALAFTPQRYVNQFEYIFPSTTCVIADLPVGQVISLFVLYPESETQTRSFVLVFAKTLYGWLIPLMRSQTLGTFELIVEQDADMLAQLYQREPPKIRLAKEDIMFRAEKLYHSWPDPLYK
ncbi:MAG: Rieske 2Fe-2S domain-containing protein [Cyanobacteria bacterium P01_A01_bin.123]